MIVFASYRSILIIVYKNKTNVTNEEDKNLFQN
jgi:hypothetical protein